MDPNLRELERPFKELKQYLGVALKATRITRRVPPGEVNRHAKKPNDYTQKIEAGGELTIDELSNICTALHVNITDILLIAKFLKDERTPKT